MFSLTILSKLKNIKKKKPVYLQPINEITLDTMKYEQFLQMLVCTPQNKIQKFININTFIGKKLKDTTLPQKKKYSVKNKVQINGLNNNDQIKNWMINILLSNINDINREIQLTLFNTFYPKDNMILLYHVKNYRYCENISREHVSNNVYFIINYNKS